MVGYTGDQQAAFDRWENWKAKRPGSTSASETIPSPRSVKVDIPIANVGEPVPNVVGRRRVTRPNILWYGNLAGVFESVTETVTEQEKVWNAFGNFYELHEVTTEKTTVYPIGYTADIQFGVCLGPDVRLLGVYYNNEQIWSGNIGPARASVTLTAPDTPLDGAELIWNGGAFNQPVDPVLAGEPDMPAYVGIAYAIIRGLAVDQPLQGLAFEVARHPNPLALSAANNVNNDDINVASAIVEIITSEWGGAAVDIADIDTVSFTAGAQQLAIEGNFCSIIIEEETPGAVILAALQQQAYSMIYQNPATGKIEFKLIRSTVPDLSGVPSFSEYNIAQLQDFDKEPWSNTIQQLRGVYVERDNDYEPTPVMVQTVASPPTGRGKRSAQQSYPYVTRSALCLSLASRDLARSQRPLFKARLVVTRDGADLKPGSLIIVNWKDYNLFSVPMVVGQVKKLPLNENVIILDVVEYEIPAIEAVFDQPATPFDPGVNLEPQSPASSSFYTAPYYMARSRGLVSPDQANQIVAPVILPVPANDIQLSFTAHLSNQPNTGKTLYIEDGSYATYGELSAAIDKYDGWQDGLIASVNIDSVVNPANLRNIGLDGVRAGKLFAFVGNEIISFEACVDNGNNQWTLTNVHRGLLDTVAESHAQGTPIHIISNNYNMIPSAVFSYPLTFSPNWRIHSNTPNKRGRYEDALSTNGWAPADPRTQAPPRPHDTMIDGVRPTDAAPIDIFTGVQIDVTWRTRSRLALTVALQDDAAENGEINSSNEYQVHRVLLIDAAATTHDLGVTADTGNANTLTVTVPAGAALGAGQLYVRSEVTLPFGTIQSQFRDLLPVNVLPGGLILTADETSYLTTVDGDPIVHLGV